MKCLVAAYEMHGVCLKVEAPSRALAEVVEVLLGPYAIPGPARNPFTLLLAHGNPSERRAPRPPRVFWSGVLPDGQPMILRLGSGRREMELVGIARADIAPSCRRAEMIVRPGAEWRLVDTCLPFVLCEFLAQAGHHVIHAASLVLRHGRRRAGVLISGTSGSGKTTTALQLAHSGLALLADDIAFMTCGRGRPRVWGLPTHCKVNRTTLALLPWLAGLRQRPGRVAGEFLVDASDLCASTAATVPARVILFLDSRNGRRHRLQPLDKASALARLASANVRAYEQASDGAAGRAFRALAKLVRHTDTYRLSVCPRLEELYDVIVPLVQP